MDGVNKTLRWDMTDNDYTEGGRRSGEALVSHSTIRVKMISQKKLGRIKKRCGRE